MASILNVDKIRATGSTTDAITIDSSGRVTLPQTPMFRATGADNVSLTNDTYAKIQFNTEDFDVGGYYDHSTNYRFTPLVAGKYHVGFRVYITYGSAPTEFIRAELRKNGSAYQDQYRFSDGTLYGTVQLSTIVSMNGSSDYLEAFCKAATSSDAAYYSGSHYGEFFGYFIGP